MSAQPAAPLEVFIARLWAALPSSRPEQLVEREAQHPSAREPAVARVDELVADEQAERSVSVLTLE